MTRRKEKSLITAACLSIIAVIVLFGLLGCGAFRDMPTETKVVMSYEGMGAVLQTSKPILQAFCQDGTINPADCIEARKAYNEAVSIYKFLGDIALVAIDTGNDSSYQMMTTRLMDLLVKIQGYTGDH
jgi:hypothetical protein